MSLKPHSHCPVCMSYLTNDKANTDILMCTSCNFKTYAVEKIKKSEILMGRDKDNPLDAEQQKNLDDLHYKLNMFRALYQRPMFVSSGYRPPSINAKAGGAKKSAHLSCQACDFKDQDGSLDQFCLDNLNILEALGLWLENPTKTLGWCHLQTRPASQRVFNP